MSGSNNLREEVLKLVDDPKFMPKQFNHLVSSLRRTINQEKECPTCKRKTMCKKIKRDASFLNPPSFRDEKGELHTHDTINADETEWECSECKNHFTLPNTFNCWCGWSRISGPMP